VAPAGTRQTHSPAKLRTGSATDTLEEAFVSLLPEDKRHEHRLADSPRQLHEGPPAIETHNLTRRFDQFTAVDHVSFRSERVLFRAARLAAV
jgi:ribosome-dependent ATPase